MTNPKSLLTPLQTLEAVRRMLQGIDVLLEKRRIEYIRVLTPLVPLKDLAIVQEVGDDTVVRVGPPSAAEWVRHLETRSYASIDPFFESMHRTQDQLREMEAKLADALAFKEATATPMEVATTNQDVARLDFTSSTTAKVHPKLKANLDIVAVAAHQRQTLQAPSSDPPLSMADVFRALYRKHADSGTQSLEAQEEAKYALLAKTAQSFYETFSAEAGRVNEGLVPFCSPALRADNVVSDPWTIGPPTGTTALNRWKAHARAAVDVGEDELEDRLGAVHAAAQKARVDRYSLELLQYMRRIKHLEEAYATLDANNDVAFESIAMEKSFLEDGPIADAIERFAAVADVAKLVSFEEEYDEPDPWTRRSAAARAWYEDTRRMGERELDAMVYKSFVSTLRLGIVKRNFTAWMETRTMEYYVRRTVDGLVAQCEIGWVMKELSDGQFDTPGVGLAQPNRSPYALADGFGMTYGIFLDRLHTGNPRDDVAIDDLLRKLSVWFNAPALDAEYACRFKRRLAERLEEQNRQDGVADSGNECKAAIIVRFATPLPSLAASALAFAAQWHVTHAARQRLASCLLRGLGHGGYDAQALGA